MSFDRLHPAVQHHIVNSMGWKRLRPLQEQAIAPLCDGKDALLLAPTAGGKTEAAILPLMSRMSTESWTGLSVLYLCPIRALLNNLHMRLSGYLRLIGRRCEVWHGDVSQSHRKKILRDPPDVLLTTPESLELMLVSAHTDERALFSGLRSVVVDEIHAFASEDRGWHLLFLLSRLTRITGRDIQRIGLSATVGNPDELLRWLSPRESADRVLVNPPADSPIAPDIKLDFVGSIDNAAFMISKLHRGKKRLVFCDSRARSELLTTQLRALGVSAFVSHSSLSADARRQAEQAFATGSDCVIVATSTLELGIDVGDLDHVIQIDSPSTVRSFLQRLGRTGRRAGTTRNCLFLATSPNALIQAAGLIELWKSGFVEATLPPVMPYHVYCQQVLALALQEGGISRQRAFEWLTASGTAPAIDREVLDQIIDELERQEILWSENGLLWFGQRGQAELGYRAFTELLSVFMTESMLAVWYGNQQIGQLHPLSLSTSGNRPRAVLLSGRSWRVVDVDWKKNLVRVEPSAEPGRSLWRGSAVVLSSQLCGSMRGVLEADQQPPEWSIRATDEIARLRGEHDFLRAGSDPVLTPSSDGLVWWTFAGLRANSQIAHAVELALGLRCSASNISVDIDGTPTTESLLGAIRSQTHLPVSPDAITQAAEALKFAAYLPDELRTRMLAARLTEVPGDARSWMRNRG